MLSLRSALRAFLKHPHARHWMLGFAFTLAALGINTLTPPFSSQALAPNAASTAIASVSDFEPFPSELLAAFASTATASVSAPTAAREVRTLLLHGHYDEVIDKATHFLGGVSRNDPRMLYYRGRAACSIGHYHLARHDMSALGDYKPYPKWRNAQFYVERIDAMKQVLPANTVELRDEQGAVTFRVHYDEDNEWSQTLIKLLPEAHRINRELLGRDVKEAPIFIFNDPTRFENFLHARNGDKPLGSWVWAFGGSDGFSLCQNKAFSPRDAQTDYFCGTVVHELNHCMVRRIIGDAILPVWFFEGLAVTVEPTLAPKLQLQYENRLQRAAQANALLPLQTMTELASFQETVEQMIAKAGQGDAFAQSWSMTTYLLLLLTPPKLTPFLEDVRDSRDFDQTLLKFTGLTPAAFYAKWRAQLPKVAS